MEGRRTLLHKEPTGVVSEISGTGFLRFQENQFKVINYLKSKWGLFLEKPDDQKTSISSCNIQYIKRQHKLQWI